MPISQVNRYEIRAEIGGNERGAVYRAYDPESNREVAVKLLSGNSLFTLTTQKKFSQQLSALRSLNHPALLPILDFGEEDSRPFIVTTLMEGNLTQRMTGEPLIVTEVLDMFRVIAGGLDHAASQGNFHLDLKPNNILFDAAGNPYIGDLGLVQVIDSLSAARRPQVNPYYTSPEQVRKRPITSESHVYSLAAMLFHVLTGQVLFSGASDMVAWFKHTSESPRNIRTLRADLSPAFNAVMQRALEKQPAERYKTCVAFIDQLTRAQGGALRPEDVRASARAARAEPERFPMKTARVLESQEPPIRQASGTTRALLLSTLIAFLVICAGAVAFISLLFAQP